MQLYKPSREHDLLLAQWWAQLIHDGELEQTVASSAQTLSGFLALMQPPNVLLFETDETQIVFAMWFEPCFSGAFASLWVATERRTASQSLTLVLEGYDLAFTYWPVLMGVTKQERLKRSHERLGYTWHPDPIPHLFDGEPAWLVTLTKEQYNHGRRQGHSEC